MVWYVFLIVGCGMCYSLEWYDAWYGITCYGVVWYFIIWMSVLLESKSYATRTSDIREIRHPGPGCSVTWIDPSKILLSK